MKTPKDIEFYVVIFLFLVVIFISVFGNPAKISPYHTMHTSLSPYPYEPFANKEEDDDEDDDEKEGMKGMEITSSSPIYDPVSNLEGKSSCVGNSPYSNSLGGLCMSSEVKLAIATRGNNSSTGREY